MVDFGPNINMLLLSDSKAAGNLPDAESSLLLDHLGGKLADRYLQSYLRKPGFLDFAETWIKEFFEPTKWKQGLIRVSLPVMFVPYARPDGMSEENYFKIVQVRLEKMGLSTVCAPADGIKWENLQDIAGIFVGEGHTYTLLQKLQETGSLDVIREAVGEGVPYLGSSAGTLITSPTIKTTNDMPCPTTNMIDLRSLGLVDFQINPHYMDKGMHDPNHQGETRDTRLKEFYAFNPDKPVLGLYEGQALRVEGERIVLLTSERARGLNTPIFYNGHRHEIACQVGVPVDISHLFERGVTSRRFQKLEAMAP